MLLKEMDVPLTEQPANKLGTYYEEVEKALNRMMKKALEFYLKAVSDETYMEPCWEFPRLICH